jgi:hypothetical protein
MRTKEEISRLKEWMLAEGWSPRDPAPYAEKCTQVWSKVLPGAECTHAKQGGCPMLIKLYEEGLKKDVELEVRAQKADGVWVNISFYALPGGDLVSEVSEQSSRMLRTWNYASGKIEP